MNFHIKLVETKYSKILLENAKNFIFSDYNGAESIFVGRVNGALAALDIS